MSIRSALKRRLLKDMITETCKDKHMIMVLDEHTAKVISSCMRMNEVVDAGIIAVESLRNKRESMASFAALYFLDPNEASVKLLLDDFTNTSSKYASATVFFTRTVPDLVMDLFKDAPITRRLKGLSELNVDFVTREDRVFTLGRPNTLPTLMWPVAKEPFNAEIVITARQLVSLFLTLSDEPSIRYLGTSKQCKIVAKAMEQQLTSVKASLGTAWKPRTRGTLLIVDRTIDPIAPLMHEFTYQAMASDVAMMQGEIVTLDAETLPANPTPEEINKRSLILNDAEDELWVKYRHQHVALVDLGADLKAFKSENKLAKWEEEKAKNKGSEKTVKDMAAALKDYPKYTALMNKFSKHISLRKECMDKVNSRRLMDVASLEQDLVTGYDDNNDSVDVKTAKNLLVSLCQDNSIGVEERLRLVLCYILGQGGLQASTRREMLRDVPEKCLAVFEGIANIVLEAKDERYKAPRMDSARRTLGQKRSQAIKGMRFVPAIHQIATDLITGQLDDKAYPYYGERTGEEEKRGDKRAARRRRDKDDVSVDPYIAIFVLGGVTYSEVRSIYEVAEKEKVKANLIIGSADTLTARDYLCDLAGLTKSEWTQLVIGAAGVPVSANKKATQLAVQQAAQQAAKQYNDAAADKSAKTGKPAKTKKVAEPESDDDDYEIERPDIY